MCYSVALLIRQAPGWRTEPHPASGASSRIRRPVSPAPGSPRAWSDRGKVWSIWSEPKTFRPCGAFGSRPRSRFVAWQGRRGIGPCPHWCSHWQHNWRAFFCGGKKSTLDTRNVPQMSVLTKVFILLLFSIFVYFFFQTCRDARHLPDNLGNTKCQWYSWKKYLEINMIEDIFRSRVETTLTFAGKLMLNYAIKILHI